MKQAYQQVGTKQNENPPSPPFAKGGIFQVPLFEKEGLGEILR